MHLAPNLLTLALRACSQRNKSRSKSHFRSWFWPFPDLKAWFYPLWVQSSFKSGFWNAKKESLILRTCECIALSECDLCVCILEMRVDAMHGSISAVGTKYFLKVRISCSWWRLQCLWMHIAHNTNPIRKRIVILNGFGKVIPSFVNRPNVSCLLDIVKHYWPLTPYLNHGCCWSGLVADDKKEVVTVGLGLSF